MGLYPVLYLFCIVLLVYALFIGHKLRIFEQTEDLVSDKELYKFTANVVFKQETTVTIENKYDCNAKSLRVCDINDPTTLFGCKELAVKCQHFKDDTEFKENGLVFNIPKNDKLSEGYALAISNLAKACNPNHGDLVLVTANAESSEYMLICSCKNPGYIGNTSLLNPCEEVFICDGKIDNLNQPLEKINCKCDATEHSVRYSDGLPACKTLLVKEANDLYKDWANLIDWSSDRKIQIDIFNTTIKQNVHSSVLLNPCNSSAHDLSKTINNGKYSALTKTCVFDDYGYPIRNGLLDDPATGFSHVDGALSTGEFKSIRLSGDNSGVNRFGALTAPMDFHNGIMSDMVLPRDVTVGKNTQLSISTVKNNAWGPHCETREGFRWNCYIRNKPKWWTREIPRFGFDELPSLWSQRELWNTAEMTFNESFLVDRVTGLHVDNKRLNDVAGVGFKTFGYGIKLAKSGDMGLLAFSNNNDWRAHYNTLT